jgi:hypothetical protein
MPALRQPGGELRVPEKRSSHWISTDGESDAPASRS